MIQRTAYSSRLGLSLNTVKQKWLSAEKQSGFKVSFFFGKVASLIFMQQSIINV